MFARDESLDRVEAQIEDIRDILVAPSFRHELKNLALPRSEEIIAVLDVLLAHLANIIFKQHLADHRAEEGFSFGDGAHRANQVRLG